MQTDADRGRSYRNRFFRMKGTQVGFILDSSKTYRLFQPDRDTTPRQRVCVQRERALCRITPLCQVAPKPLQTGYINMCMQSKLQVFSKLLK